MAVAYARKSLRPIEQSIAQYQLETEKQASLRMLKGAVLDTLGWAYAKAGDLDAAETAMLDAPKTGATGSITMDHLGQVYEKKGRASDAFHFDLNALRSNCENREIRGRLEQSYRKLQGSLQGLDNLLNSK
jgi:hypothetical protein